MEISWKSVVLAPRVMKAMLLGIMRLAGKHDILKISTIGHKGNVVRHDETSWK